MSDEKQIRILVTGDRNAQREELAALLSEKRNLIVVGSVGTGNSALSLTAAEQPDIIILDSDLDGCAGLSLMPRLLGAALHAKIILLAVSPSPEEQRAALRLGAAGVVTRQIAADRILQCIASVHSGSLWLEGAAISSLLEEKGFQPHKCGCNREPGIS
jgi:DNA-binding NarL/FixJ family response regulator